MRISQTKFAVHRYIGVKAMVEQNEKGMFQAITTGYSAILNALETLGLNLTLVARTAAHDMKPKIKAIINQMLGGKNPQSIQEMFDMTLPFFNMFGFKVDLEIPAENLVRCKISGCLNRFLAEQSLAEGKEGCPLCLAAFMASMTIVAFDVAEIDQFKGKANADHCIFEIKLQK